MYALVTSLLDPLTLMFFAMAIVLALLWRRQPEARKSLRWFVAVFAVAWLAFTPAVVFWAAALLERQFPPVTEMPEEADAIIVLSAGVIPSSEFVQETRLEDHTRRRCAMGARLYHHRRAPIIVAGGKVDATQPGDTMAIAMRRALVDMGVAESDILVEDQSTDTFENAANCKRLLDEHGLKHAALVTDATHLYRATRTFRRQGVAVTPVAAHYEASCFLPIVAEFVPRTSGAKTCQVVMHEIIGLAWFTLRGQM